MSSVELKGLKVPWSIASEQLRSAVLAEYMRNNSAPVFVVHLAGQTYAVAKSAQDLPKGLTQVNFAIHWWLGEWPDQAPK